MTDSAARNPGGKGWRKFLRPKLILLELASILLMMLVMVSVGMVQDMRKRSREEGREFSLQMNWHASRALLILRKKLLHNPSDEEGLAYRALTYLHRKVYENALAKLPPEDGERELFWIDYALEPFEDFITPRHVNALMPQVVEALKRLEKRSSRTTYYLDVGRYEAAHQLYDYIYDCFKYWGVDGSVKRFALHASDKMLADIFLQMEERPLSVGQYSRGQSVAFVLAQQAYIRLGAAILHSGFDCDSRPDLVVVYPAIVAKAVRVLDELERNPRIQFGERGVDKYHYINDLSEYMASHDALAKLRATCLSSINQTKSDQP